MTLYMRISRLARCLRDNKGGMTLIEIIIGVLIFTVVATSAASILTPVLRAYTRANDLAESNTLLDILSDEMLSDLSRASEVTINGTELTIQTNVNTVIYDVGGTGGGNEGLLCRIEGGAEIPVLDRGFYKRKTVGLYYCFIDDAGVEQPAVGGEPAFIVRITVFSEGDPDPIAEMDYAARPLGLNSYAP